LVAQANVGVLTGDLLVLPPVPHREGEVRQVPQGHHQGSFGKHDVDVPARGVVFEGGDLLEVGVGLDEDCGVGALLGEGEDALGAVAHEALDPVAGAGVVGGVDQFFGGAQVDEDQVAAGAVDQDLFAHEGHARDFSDFRPSAKVSVMDQLLVFVRKITAFRYQSLSSRMTLLC
jgi:hypothetical protein